MVRSASPDRTSFGAAAARSETIWAEVLIAADRLTDALERHAFDPNQPRVPAGRPDGGDWVAGIGSGIARPASDGGRPRDRIRLADASGTPSPEFRAELKRRIDAADERLDNTYRRASSGLEISHAEIERSRLAIADKAQDRVGSMEWAQDVAKDNYPSGTNKCNLFVYDMLKSVEADPPLANGGIMYNWFGEGVPKYPVLAGQWANTKFAIPGWDVVDGLPVPGDVIARSTPFGWAPRSTGHVAIFVGFDGDTPRTVSARESSVVFETWPFKYSRSEYVVRRYRGVRAP